MGEWLNGAAERIADQVGDDAADYAVSEDDANRLLGLAGVAAHSSGERTNAPLVTFLVGYALGRHEAASLEQIAQAARGESGQ
jgi:Domain of unknown function (DUF6457)